MGLGCTNRKKEARCRRGCEIRCIRVGNSKDKAKYGLDGELKENFTIIIHIRCTVEPL